MNGLTFYILLLLSGSVILSCQDKNKPLPDTVAKDSLPVKKVVTPEQNEDEMLPNQRFGKSEIINPKFPRDLLFGIWAEKDSPACDFTIDEKVFFLCDMEGDSDRLYLINGDSIFLDNPTLIFKGKIINVTKDSLIIHWQQNENPQVLLRWKD